MRDVTQALVETYGQSMADQGYSPATAQNYVSAVNTVMSQARGGQWDTVSPSQATGLSRDNVRQAAPSSLDRDQVAAALKDLQARGLERAAAVLNLAREAGLRMEEASKQDLGRLAKEAANGGAVTVRDGTKGGRGSPTEAPREIPATAAVRDAIEQARAASPAGSRNLIAPAETFAAFRDRELNPARATLQAHGIKGFHDARAAYACDRYRDLTGHRTPAEAGHRAAPKEGKNGDRAARETIALELGHNREDVVASYVGSTA
jgi:hypothetical protein